MPKEDPTLAKIRRRLEAWELQHLRTHAAEQAERIEALEAELLAMRNEYNRAAQSADYWHEQCTGMIDQLLEDGGAAGLTQGGEFVVVEPCRAAVEVPA